MLSLLWSYLAVVSPREEDKASYAATRQAEGSTVDEAARKLLDTLKEEDKYLMEKAYSAKTKVDSCE